MSKRSFKRTSGMQIREILQLSESGDSSRKIKSVLKKDIKTGYKPKSKSTINRILKKAKEKGIDYEKAIDLTDEQLEEIIFKGKDPEDFDEPDWDWVLKESSKKHVTLKLLYEGYYKDNNNIKLMSYTTFTRRYNAYKNQPGNTMLMDYDPGDKVFVDYAGSTYDYLDAETEEVKTAYFFVGQLGFSNLIYTEAVANRNQLSWTNSHVNMFEYFNGVPLQLIPDNCKTAITKSSLYDPDKNKSFSDLSRHYGFEIVPARTRKPKDKGKVENGVRHISRRIIARLRNETFLGLSELNNAVHRILEELNNKPLTNLTKSRQELFSEYESEQLQPLPSHRYESGKWHERTVPPCYHIVIDGHKYSINYNMVGKKLRIKVTANMIYFYFNYELIGSHVKSNIQGGKTTLKKHMHPAHRAYKESISADKLLQRADSIGGVFYKLIKRRLKRKKEDLRLYRYLNGLDKMIESHGVDSVKEIFEILESDFIELPRLERIGGILKSRFYKNKSSEEEAYEQTLKNENVRGASYYSETSEVK